jgi:hypothetical protein
VDVLKSFIVPLTFSGDPGANIPMKNVLIKLAQQSDFRIFEALDEAHRHSVLWLCVLV